MIRAHTTSADGTRSLAEALASLATAGDLLLLAGDLGAGKTAFAQGFGRGLGIHDPITSPTFTLARQYLGGRLTLHHLDVYRLEQMEEVLDVDLPELLDDDAATLIEWGDAIIPALPADYLEVRITFVGGDDERSFELLPIGTRWNARARQLTEVLGPWNDGVAGGC